MQNLTHRSDVANRLRRIELGDDRSELGRQGERSPAAHDERHAPRRLLLER